MSRMPADRWQAALLRALKPVAGPFTVVAAHSTSWASATFEGSRHRLALRLDGPDGSDRAARLAAELAETDLPLAGGFVADLSAVSKQTGAEGMLGVEALIIEEA